MKKYYSEYEKYIIKLYTKIYTAWVMKAIIKLLLKLLLCCSFKRVGMHFNIYLPICIVML